MTIFIPTYGRSGSQVTFANLPEKVRSKAYLVVQNREKHLYDAFPRKLILPPKIQTVAPTRQWIMEWAYRHGEDYVVMLDDDIRFATRRKDDPTKFTDATDKDIVAMLESIYEMLGSYAHVGVLAREGGNRRTEVHVYNTRMTRILAYDTKVFIDNKIKFNRLPLQEDFDVTLQLLRRGCENAVLCNWVHDQKQSNAPGGCSTFRTKEMHDANAEALASLHPDFVKVVEKTTKGAWGGGTRKDVVVQWKKAYQSSFKD